MGGNAYPSSFLHDSLQDFSKNRISKPEEPVDQNATAAISITPFWNFEKIQLRNNN